MTVKNEQSNQFSIYLLIVVAYALLLSVLLLMPFDFHGLFPFRENNVRWLSEMNGVEFSSPGSIRSSSPPQGLYDALVLGTGLTLEVWVATKNDQQGGPARIVSYSNGTRLRNFTLGQTRRDLVMRLRTIETDLDGSNPALTVQDIFHPGNPQHIVITYDYSEENVYVNGNNRLRAQIPGGDFSNWDPSYPLVLGNEATGDRPWLGKLFLIAIYNRVLSEQEIGQNYKAGKVFDSSMKAGAGRVVDGLVVLHLFDEGTGDVVLDRSGSVPPIDLKILTGPQITNQAFLSSPYKNFDLTFKQVIGVIGNIILFIPLGFLFHAAMMNRNGSSLKIAAFVLMVGALFTLSIESLQYFSATRFSSMTDVVNNMLGTSIGIVIDKRRMSFFKGTTR